MKLKSVVALLFYFLLISSFIVGAYVYAKDDGTSVCGTDGCTLQNPLGSVSTPQQLIGKVINGFLGVTGSIALIVFIWGGFTWMTSAGSSEKVAHGKETIVWATIGLVVIFSAYAMVRFVFTDILGASKTTATTSN